MRRPQPASGLVAVMASLLVATIFATPAGAAFAPAESGAAQVLSATRAECTPWRSEYLPPPTIRVLRTYRTKPTEEVKGTIQTVDFREYVATVMAAEWPERYPLETLKAGAVAVKQFAWYYVLNWRGGTRWIEGTKVCYDVVDNTNDQWYKPERYAPGLEEGPAADSKILRAIDATWDVSVRKYSNRTGQSRFFLTGYRDGSGGVACGGDATGFKLYHNSTRLCGEAGLTYREILRRYLRPNLEIVTPGQNQVIGTRHGDASAMQQTRGRRTARVWTPGRSAPEPGSATGLSFSTDELIAYASGDMDGDGRRDLVWLRKTGPTAGLVMVALSDGTNYGPAQEWWSGDTLVPLNGATLLVGDLHADQRSDLAILSTGPAEGTSRMVVLKRRAYAASSPFVDAVVWWTAPQEPNQIAGAWLGDISGDGRADLIIRVNPEAGGVRIKTAITAGVPAAAEGRMSVFRSRFEAPAMNPAKVKMTVADADRDGQDDILLLIGAGARVRIERLQGGKLGQFRRTRLWVAPRKDPIPVGNTRLGTADVDYDGRTDLVLYSRSGAGTRIRVLRSRQNTMIKGPDWRVGLDWRDIRPY